MKKKLLILISIPIIGIILYYGFLFLAISWVNYFSNPHRKELTIQEIELFRELKKEYKFKEVYRTPEIEKDYYKDSIYYKIGFRGFNCNNKDNLYLIAKNIVEKANQKLNIESKFYDYKIRISCAGEEYFVKEFKFNRDSLNKGLYK